MAEQKSETFDPFTAWRDWLSQFERQANAFWNERMGTEEYNRLMSQMNQFSLESQKAMGAAAARTASALNLPTRDDFNALSQRLATVEERLRELEKSLGRSESASGRTEPTSPRPPRTRRPVSQRGPSL
jgi:BMFP domain-containing protein YqiC